MKVSLSLENQSKMNFLDKVRNQQVSDRKTSKPQYKNVDVEYDLMKKMPKGSGFIGKVQKTSLRQAITFAKRNNIDNEEYFLIPLRTPAKKIHEILKSLRDEKSGIPSPKAPSVWENQNLDILFNDTKSVIDEIISTYRQSERKSVNLTPMHTKKNSLNPLSHRLKFNYTSANIDESGSLSNLNSFLGRYKNYKLKNQNELTPQMRLENKVISFHSNKLRKTCKLRESMPNLKLPSLSSPNSASMSGCPFTFSKKADERSMSDTSSMMWNLKLSSRKRGSIML